MAKILISYYSENTESTYEAISQTLFNEGNDLLRVNIRGWINCKSWAGKSVLRDSKLLNMVSDFSPDIILNFSHSLPIEVCENLLPHTKNCLIDGDNPNYFWNLDYLKKNLNKYYFLGMQTASREMFKQVLGEINDEKYLYFPAATSFEHLENKKNKNISFIGSSFFQIEMPRSSNLLTDDFYQIYDQVKKNYMVRPEDLNDSLRKSIDDINASMNLVKFHITWQDRVQHLSLLTDLGLHIYGLDEWKYIRFYNAELGRAFNPVAVRSLQENQEIYNTSKICINISHPQAKTAFSWRVMDIMASSACVLTEYKTDWVQLFSSYISEEVVEAIVYRDRYEMREKAKRLLNDEKFRQRCVLECNAAIEKNGRWKHRFIELENFLKIKLISNVGQSEYNFFPAVEKKKISLVSLFFQRRKKEIDIFLFCLLLVFSLLPVFGTFIDRKKIIKRMNKRIPH
jgi:hypothetical protein